ncbi:hypothetical protein Ocin01_17875, partial [Orchesella cincta]
HKRKNAGKRWCAGACSEEVPTSGLDEEYSYTDYENSYEFSTARKAPYCWINATILIACAFTCIEWPSFCQLPSLRQIYMTF